MKKLTALLLTAVLCLSLITTKASAASTDTVTISASTLNMMGALQGDGSGSLNLDGTLTRAQFCKIAVVVMGLSGSVGKYSGYTIFPDVPSTNWAAGYVNLAVRSAGIMSGYANGTFGPNDIITYGQAVTVLVKMLGYTTADVGAKWPDDFIAKAEEIGLTDGVSLAADSSITRGSAAVLFVNLLNTAMNGSTKAFMESISGATVLSNVFLVSTNATTDDGTTGAVKIAGGSSGTYLPANSVPDALWGLYGSLVLNASGKALVLVPAKGGETVVSTVKSATVSSIKCTDGTTITIPSTASFYLDGTMTAYSSGWLDITGGMLVSAYYSEGGAVQCVLVTDSASSGSGVTVVTSDSYALPSGSVVYLNGIEATAADIEKYDVVTDSGAGYYNVTRSRISGRFNDATPSTAAPESVTVLGTEFEVLDSAAASFSALTIGSGITLLLTSDNKVAGAVSSSALQNTNYGVVASLTSSSASVTLTNGVTISSAINDVSSEIDVGSFVTVASLDASKIILSEIGNREYSGLTLNPSAGKLGGKSLSKAITIYERVGTSAAIEISLSDILTDTVEASNIGYYAVDPAGYVSVLVLNDATGDAYTYGFIKNGSSSQSSGSLSATNATTSVTNSDGTSTAVIGTTGIGDGTPAGIAATGGGKLAGFAELTAVTGISRYDFQKDADGMMFVETDTGIIRVADDVQCYIKSSGLWTTLEKARSYSDNLTVYYDRTMSTGKVRVIIAY